MKHHEARQGEAPSFVPDGASGTKEIFASVQDGKQLLEQPYWKDLRITVDIKPKMNQERTLLKRGANHMLGCIREKSSQWKKWLKGSYHPLSICFLCSHFWNTVSSLRLPTSKVTLKYTKGLSRWLPRWLRGYDLWTPEKFWETGLHTCKFSKSG